MCSFYLHTACCLSQLLLSELSIWMSTLLLQRVMQQQVSLGLSVSSPPPSVFLCLCPSLSLCLSFLPSVLTAIIMCLPNGIHFFSTLCEHLYFSMLDVLPHFPTHSDCNGWNGESLLLSCLSFPIVYSQSLDSVPSDSLGGKWTLWHFTRWNVAVHGITCKHCSLLPWQLRTKIQPSCTCLCQRLQTNRTFQLQDVQHDQSWEAVFFSIFLFPACLYF